MKLIGFSRRTLEGESSVEAVFKAAESSFGGENLKMELVDIRTESQRDVDFNVERAAKELKDVRSLGLFIENVVTITIDNQMRKNRYYAHPHSTVEIETLQNDCPPILSTEDWLSLA